VVWNHPHGGGDRDPDLRRDFFVDLVSRFIHLVYSSRCGNRFNGTSSVLYATVAEMIAPSARSRGYGLYYAITLGSGGIAPIVYGLLTDSFGLSLTIIAVA